MSQSRRNRAVFRMIGSGFTHFGRVAVLAAGLALAGGQVDFAMENLGAVQPMVQTGRVRLLAARTSLLVPRLGRSCARLRGRALINTRLRLPRRRLPSPSPVRLKSPPTFPML